MTVPANPPTDPVTGPGTTPPAPAPTTPPPTEPPTAPTAPPAADDAAKIAAMEESLKNTGKERDDFKAILEKLGAVLNPGSAADPQKLAATLEQRDAELAENRMELAVLKLAGGEVGSELLDSRRFMKAVKGLDPAGEAFAAKVKAELESRKPAEGDEDGKTAPKQKPPSKSAGADINGGRTGNKKQLTRADLAAMSSAEIVKAQNDGLLDNLMKGVG